MLGSRLLAEGASDSRITIDQVFRVIWLQTER